MIEDIDKVLRVVGYMNPNCVVSKGTTHAHIKDVTILLNGRTECNPCNHRRDWADLMLACNLYVKVLPSGLYEAGSHDVDELHTYVDVHPGVALTFFFYDLLTR